MIHWKLTEQQADQILNALAQRPFVEVSGLIGALMQQVQEQQQKAGQISGGRAATQEHGQQNQQQAPEVPQAVNGLDQRV